MRFIYHHDGSAWTIDLESRPDGSYTATIGDRVLTVSARDLDGGEWRMTVDGEAVTAHIAADGSARHVAINGEVFTLTVPDRRVQRRTGSSGGDLTAPMPGQIVAVAVGEGDAVEVGQTLVIMEAMKMEIRVAAPRAGAINRVLVAPGDGVERGQRLLEMA